MTKKAYGFPISEYPTGDVRGACIDQDGKLLGTWISSNLNYLATDLKKHALGYDYKFLLHPPEEIKIQLG